MRLLREGGRSARALLGAGLTAAVLGSAVPVLAAGSGTATVKPSAEGWYRLAPTCSLPTGCADLGATPSPYAPDTLHVGVNAGQEEARTYLQLDLAKLPSGTKPSGGVLLLPVAAGPEDGTRAAETAKLRACAVRDEVKDVDGAFTEPPRPDCQASETPAVFVAAAADKPAAFTIELSDLAAAWDSDARPGAVALVAAAETAPPDSWHVAFSDRTRKGDGVSPIAATLALVSASFDSSEQEPPVVKVPPFETAPEPALDAGTSSFDSRAGSTGFPAPAVEEAPLLPAPATQAAPVAAGPVQQVVPAAQSFVQQGFRYPAVFLLPLLLAIGAGCLGRALTRDLADMRP